MIILTNGLTNEADEGFLNVACSFIKRIKKVKAEDCYIITFERKSELSDKHIKTNKLLINRELISLIRKRKEKVLYIPFPAKTMATSIRIFILSLFSRKELQVIWVQKAALNSISKILLRISRVKIVVLSRESKEYFSKIIKEKNVSYLKAGVDTERFKPVDLQKQKSLKQKYGLDPERPVILHVGHLKQGRNVSEMLKLDSKNQVLFVFSTLFKNDSDKELRNRFVNTANVSFIEDYVPDIQEIYQLSDLYFFPVIKEGNCIDVPLSCLEAAACNKPIITTDYGEMKEFVGKNGFYFIDSFDEVDLNELVSKALRCENVDTRLSVMEYDWKHAIKALADRDF